MNDEKIIRLIQSNPDKGIRMSMQLYGKGVNTICRTILRDCDEGLIDEAVSDTFLKLWQKSHLYVAKDGYSLKSWIYSIARNTAIDIRRKNGYTIPSLDDVGESEPVSADTVETQVQQRATRQIIHEVITMLGEPDGQVFFLKYFVFMKNKEIAARLHISEKKTENILYRGKRKLKELLMERGITCYED